MLTVPRIDVEDMVEMDLEVTSIHMVEVVLVMVTGLLMVILLDLTHIWVDHNHHLMDRVTTHIITNPTQHGDLEALGHSTVTEVQVDVTVLS